MNDDASGMQYKTICMIHHGRVGSTVLANLINQCKSSGIYSAEECFHPAMQRQYNLSEDRLNYLIHLQHEGARTNFTEKLAKELFISNNFSHFIFEYKPNSIGCEVDTVQAIREYQLSGVDGFIFLYRSNYIRRIISLYSAISTSVWHVHVGAEPVATKSKVYIDINKILDQGFGLETGLLDAIAVYNHELEKLFKCLTETKHLILNYEDDVLFSPLKGLRKILQFSECSLESIDSLHISLARQHPGSLEDHIENFDEVRDLIVRDGRYVYMLD